MAVKINIPTIEGMTLKTKGKYVADDIFMEVDKTNFTADNIKKDVTILGVTGTYEGEGGGNDVTLRTFLTIKGSSAYLFQNYTETSVDNLISYSDTENVTNMTYMFSGCTNLKTIPLLNTINVTDMSYMFYNCTNLEAIPQLDTSNVKSFSRTFGYCANLKTIPQLDTSNATDMGKMFMQCTNLEAIPQLDTSNISSLQEFFQNCQKLQIVPQLDTNNVNDMRTAFYNCLLLQKIDITSMDKIVSINNTSSMFQNCYSLTKFIIRTMTTIPPLNTSSFSNCYHFIGKVNSTYNPEGLKDGRIYAPDDFVEQLKEATNWSAYADIIVPLSTLVE